MNRGCRTERFSGRHHFSKPDPPLADKLRMAVFWRKRDDRKPSPIEENEEHRLIEVVQRWYQEFATASDLFANPATVYGDVRQLVKRSLMLNRNTPAHGATLRPIATHIQPNITPLHDSA